MAATEAANANPMRRRTNGWAVLPLRIFLAAVFLFAGYAKLAYPHFFDPSSVNGFKASIDAAKSGTPISGILGPLSDHPSAFGHITAYAELAIGLGLLVGLLTRIAAAGGMLLMAGIVLSINWAGVKEYTGSSGWFTSVDLAVAAALSVFLLGGADIFSLDGLIWRLRNRREVEDEEPGFADTDLAASRARLQGEWPTGEQPTQRLAEPEPEPNSMWNAGRRDQGYADARPTEQFEPVPSSERPVQRTGQDRPAEDYRPRYQPEPQQRVTEPARPADPHAPDRSGPEADRGEPARPHERPGSAGDAPTTTLPRASAEAPAEVPAEPPAEPPARTPVGAEDELGAEDARDS